MSPRPSIAGSTRHPSRASGPDISRDAVARLLRPRSVAIVGASEDPRTMGGNVLINLRRAAFAGELHLVSRTKTEIGGQRCLRSIDDLPEGVDSLVLIVPQEAVKDSLAACIRRKVNGAVVFASGFAEAGPEGAARQREIADIARAGGLALNGPNNLGLINYTAGIPLTFGEYRPMAPARSVGVAVLAQSGAIASCIRDSLVASGLAVTYFISTGNEAVLTVEDFLDPVLDDAATGVVALFVEEVRRPQRLLQLAARARAAGKAIVLMQPGRTEAARHAALSHTGALSGDLAVMRAALAHAGVAMVDGLDALVDVTMLLAARPLPETAGVAFMTNSGAMRGIALDCAQDTGLDLVEWRPETATALRELYPPFIPIDNPLDTGTVVFTQPEILGETARLVLADPGVGALIVSMFPGRAPQQIEKAVHILPAARASQKPVAFVMLGDPMQLDAEFMRLIGEERVALFRSTERAIRAVAALTRVVRERAGKAAEATPFLAPPPAPLPSGTIPEHRAKPWLAAAGIAVPEGALAMSVDEAEAIAARIGYPVALKAQSPELAHKSDAGGVILNVDAAGVRSAWKMLHENVRRRHADLALEGVLVERMAAPGIEVIVGVRRDPDWGPILLLGLGGIWVETLKDVQVLSADAGEEAIREALGRLRGAAILAGTRGTPPADRAAIVATARRLALLLRQSSGLQEIEINPLIVYAEGKGALAVDALLINEDGPRPSE